jgi:very-short-patch-repair endonuclease
LDGACHDDLLCQAYDAKRQAYLEAQGITVLRFENKMIYDNPEEVVAYISKRLTQ